MISTFCPSCTAPARTVAFPDQFYVFSERKDMIAETNGSPYVANQRFYFSQLDGRARFQDKHQGNTTDVWVEAGRDQMLKAVTSGSSATCNAGTLVGSMAGQRLNVSNADSPKLGT